MSLHEGEKFRCEDCNAQIAVIRSSDTRSLDYEGLSVEPDATPAQVRAWTDKPLHLSCCGKPMVRFCIRAA